MCDHWTPPLIKWVTPEFGITPTVIQTEEEIHYLVCYVISLSFRNKTRYPVFPDPQEFGGQGTLGGVGGLMVSSRVLGPSLKQRFALNGKIYLFDNTSSIIISSL